MCRRLVERGCVDELLGMYQERLLKFDALVDSTLEPSATASSRALHLFLRSRLTACRWRMPTGSAGFEGSIGESSMGRVFRYPQAFAVGMLRDVCEKREPCCDGLKAERRDHLRRLLDFRLPKYGSVLLHAIKRAQQTRGDLTVLRALLKDKIDDRPSYTHLCTPHVHLHVHLHVHVHPHVHPHMHLHLHCTRNFSRTRTRTCTCIRVSTCTRTCTCAWACACTCTCTHTCTALSSHARIHARTVARKHARAGMTTRCSLSIRTFSGRASGVPSMKSASGETAMRWSCCSTITKDGRCLGSTHRTLVHKPST